MKGLYTVAEIARYFGSRPQEVARMIREDALPAVELPGKEKLVKKITLHGLHGWLAARHSGSAFMTVDQLAAEIAAANAAEAAVHPGLAQVRACFELLMQSAREKLEGRAA